VARIFEEAANHLVEDMKPLHKDIDPGEKEENLLEIWNQLFEHIAEHARLYRAMLGKNGSPWFAARMREHIIKLMLEKERWWKHQVGPRQPIDPAMPPELPVMQLSHVLIGTIVWWLESEKRYTPRQIATWFYRFAFYGYLSARGYEAHPPGKE
ncbi:MAG TPA: TetR-like C-terminal domain-containing protein, partial [Ktedonobacteraceae bacterium]|nr:TetR-like C-terminal domain-containing protein [Ktedonobacteraceae bacterium]